MNCFENPSKKILPHDCPFVDLPQDSTSRDSFDKIEIDSKLSRPELKDIQLKLGDKNFDEDFTS